MATDIRQGELRSGLGAAACSQEYSELQPLPISAAVRALASCAWRTGVLLAQRRIRQPADHVGRRISFADGSSGQIYRETVIQRHATVSPAVLVVCFRLRLVKSGWAHRLFRIESELNTVLFAGFPGLVSKLWMCHDQNGLYRGFYQWDDPNLAVAYVRALWWVLALVSEKGSIHYAVLPGLDRDEVIRDPSVVDVRLSTSQGGWWRPVGTTVANPTAWRQAK